MSRMLFGVGMGRDEPLSEIPRQVRAVEEHGYDRVSFIDTQSLARDVYVMMTLAVENSDRLHVGHGVTNPFTRHPAVTANATGSINELSGKRAYLGIGAGFSSTGTLGLDPRPVEHLRRTVLAIRGLASGEDVEWEGSTIRSEWMREAFPIILGSDGPRSLQLAGEVGDGVDFPLTDPAMVQWRLDRLHEGAARAGRDLTRDGFQAWARTGVFVGDSKEQARSELRSYVATYAHQFYLSHLRKETSFSDGIRAIVSPDLLEDIRKLAKAFEMYEHEKIGGRNEALVTDEMVDYFMVCGTADDCIERLEALRALGVDRVMYSVYPLRDKVGMITRFAEEVMPAFA